MELTDELYHKLWKLMQEHMEERDHPQPSRMKFTAEEKVWLAELREIWLETSSAAQPTHNQEDAA